MDFGNNKKRHRECFIVEHSKNPYKLTNRIFPNEALLSGSWSSNSCRIGNYVSSQWILGSSMYSTQVNDGQEVLENYSKKPSGNHTFLSEVHHWGLGSTRLQVECFPDSDGAPHWGMCDFHRGMGSCFYPMTCENN